MDHLYKTYAQVVSKTRQIASPKTQVAPKQTEVAPKQTEVAPKQTDQTKNVAVKCLYNEICYKGKLCGNCLANEYQMDMYYTYCDNFKLDRQMDLKYNKDE